MPYFSLLLADGPISYIDRKVRDHVTERSRLHPNHIDDRPTLEDINNNLIDLSLVCYKDGINGTVYNYIVTASDNFGPPTVCGKGSRLSVITGTLLSMDCQRYGKRARHGVITITMKALRRSINGQPAEYLLYDREARRERRNTDGNGPTTNIHFCQMFDALCDYGNTWIPS
ncbi:hypothetical protein CHS0354_041244 [Potamilus streckersoni]|uniref:Uncharacterized protein n=1 Tax=Potamilus streckersoni TaxID=2493646 RepID=A0AAE0VTM2_9BIVA|nr:hypothetical protein CHS0354_041244 [Potamilus streckersoni]